MLWLWTLLAALGALAGIRHVVRMRSVRSSERPPRVDDEALRRILETGSLGAGDDDDAPDRLDMDAAARAEDEFWSETWDEPEEYRP